LKHDRFAEEVQHSVEYLGEHRKQVTRYGIAALIVVLLVAGYYFFSQRQHSQRHEALKEALRIQEAAVGGGSSEFVKSFPTQAEKDKAVVKAFTDLASKHPGTDVGYIAKYYLGIVNSDQGRLQDAEKYLKEVSADGPSEYAALANYSLAMIYDSQGKGAEAEKILRGLLARPTMLVSKEQATVSLAKVIARNKPDEARKLLEPMRTERSAVSRAAIQAMSELPKK
jgi:predicted negative regulator of RcsB-dependent stress response